jgi:hypothetical protein
VAESRLHGARCQPMRVIGFKLTAYWRSKI